LDHGATNTAMLEQTGQDCLSLGAWVLTSSMASVEPQDLWLTGCRSISMLLRLMKKSAGPSPRSGGVISAELLRLLPRGCDLVLAA
jgi:hypothetical protein